MLMRLCRLNHVDYTEKFVRPFVRATSKIKGGGMGRLLNWKKKRAAL